MFAKSILMIGVVAALSACGGGGGDAPAAAAPVVSATSFPLQTAALAAKKVSRQGSFVITGNCTGTGTENIGAPNPSTLYGSTYARSAVIVLNYTNCSGSGAETLNIYMDALYNTIAQVRSNGVFSEATVVNNTPLNVKVGDTVTLRNIRTYNNSTKLNLTGTSVQTLVVEADTQSSVILNYITQSYDATNKLSNTTQDRSRLTTTGSINYVSYQIDVPSGQKEIWTYN